MLQTSLIFHHLIYLSTLSVAAQQQYSVQVCLYGCQLHKKKATCRKRILVTTLYSTTEPSSGYYTRVVFYSCALARSYSLN